VFAADNLEATAEGVVNDAVQVIQEKGVDYGYKLLNTRHFFRGEVYPFAGTLDGTLHAHPANKDLVGKNHLELKDTQGKLYYKEFIEVAKNQGSGWVDYYWLRHGEKEPTLKKTYVKRVPGTEVWVGAGYYVK
jgi:signal transduction histidine kinase